jgi:hypothetical protein
MTNKHKFALAALSCATLALAEWVSPVSGDKLGMLNGRNIRSGGVDFVLSKSSNPRKWEKLTEKEKAEILERYINRQLIKEQAFASLATDKEFQDQLYFIVREYAIEYWEHAEKEKMVISDAQVQKHYDDHKGEASTVTSVKLRRATITDRTSSQGVLEKLDSAKGSEKLPLFELLSEKGSDLGWIQKDKLAPEYAKLINQLKVGEHAVIESPKGLTALWFEDESNKTVGAKESRATIEQTLKNELFKQRYLELGNSLKTKAIIKGKIERVEDQK